MVGRRNNANVAVQWEQTIRKLCNLREQKLAQNVYVTLFRGLSLKEYVMARKANCQNQHKQPCSRCSAMLLVAVRVAEAGYCMLAEGFRLAYPDQRYKPDIAIGRLLQMPLASIRVGTPESGKAACFLIEYVPRVDYIDFAHFSQALFKADSPSFAIGLDKKAVKSLLGLAQSDKERELIRYSVFKSSGMSVTAARQHFGFEGMQERSKRIEDCIEAAHSIRKSIDELAEVQDQALLIAMRLKDVLSESETDSESESDSGTHSTLPAEPEGDSGTHSILSAEPERDSATHSLLPVTDLPAFNVLTKVLQDGQYNWFVVADFLEELNCNDVQKEKHLNAFFTHVMEFPLDLEQRVSLQLHTQRFMPHSQMQARKLQDYSVAT